MHRKIVKELIDDIAVARLDLGNAKAVLNSRAADLRTMIDKLTIDLSLAFEEVSNKLQAVESKIADNGSIFLGEKIQIRDKHGDLVSTVRVDNDGRFISPVGSLSKEEFGNYVLSALSRKKKGPEGERLVTVPLESTKSKENEERGGKIQSRKEYPRSSHSSRHIPRGTSI